MKSIKQRFWEKVDKNGPNGCWIWIGTKSGGYGYFRSTKMTLVHRYSWELHNGPIPIGLVIGHKEFCRNKGCINPDHLICYTPQENNSESDGIYFIRRNKTHCPLGHEYSEANTKFYRNKRHCRTCIKMHNDFYNKIKKIIKME